MNDLNGSIFGGWLGGLGDFIENIINGTPQSQGFNGGGGNSNIEDIIGSQSIDEIENLRRKSRLKDNVVQELIRRQE